MSKLESGLVGVAGEYLVAGELSLRGFIASISLRNTRGIDIMVSSAEGDHQVTVQVKTNSDGGTSWILGKKAEGFHHPAHFYVFVGLANLGERPRFHVVPSEVVAEFVTRTHREWLSGAKKNGEPRKDTNMRKFDDHEDTYRDRWDLLEAG